MFPVHNRPCLGQCLLPVVNGYMGPCKVGGAEPRGLWYVIIGSVAVSQLHNSIAAHWRNTRIITYQAFYEID